MATWTSQNEMFADLKAGNYTEARLHKLAPGLGAVGRSMELFTGAGVPAAGTFSGAAGSWNACTAATTGAMTFQTQGAISPETRHMLHAYGNIHSVGAPVDLEIWDLLGYHPACVVTGTATTLTAPTLPTRATGKRDIQALIGVQSALGAASPSLTVTYQDQDGNASQASPYAMVSPANSAPIGTMFGHATGGVIEMPLAAPDTGITRIVSYTIASGTTGTVFMAYARRICSIPIRAINEGTILDFVNIMGGNFQIDDDACLIGILANMGGIVPSGGIIKGRFGIGWSS